MVKDGKGEERRPHFPFFGRSVIAAVEWALARSLVGKNALLSPKFLTSMRKKTAALMNPEP